MIRGEHTPTGQNRCRFCERHFYHEDLSVDICRTCYFNGREHEERMGDLLPTLERLPGIKSAGVWHTGGGCWALLVRRHRDEHYLMGTTAFRDATDGEWETDPDVPETGDGPWCLGQCDGAEDSNDPIGEVLMPVDKPTLIAYVRGFGAPLPCPECGHEGQPSGVAPEHWLCRACDLEFTEADGVIGWGL